MSPWQRPLAQLSSPRQPHPSGRSGEFAGGQDSALQQASPPAGIVAAAAQSVTLTSTGSVVSLAGQNSVVKHIVVTFNQAVTVASDAFTVTPRTGGWIAGWAVASGGVVLLARERGGGPGSAGKRTAPSGQCSAQLRH